MIGRRLAVVDGKLTIPREPGDYCGPVFGYTDDKPAVFFLKPNARDEGVPPVARSIQHVVSPPHTFRECPDGSLEIRNSLSDMHDGVSDVPGVLAAPVRLRCTLGGYREMARGSAVSDRAVIFLRFRCLSCASYQ